MTSLKKLSHKEFVQLNSNNKKAAEVMHLVYVNDNQTAGIKRIKQNNKFIYVLGNKRIKNKAVVERINKLVIPPAWKNVWICPFPNGHLQATGFDARQRKQYKYHILWNYLRSETKFHHMLEFGRVLPKLRLQIEKDVDVQELTENKVIATVLSLMERTYIRIGNEDYEKQNGSYGLTTLKDKHVNISGDNIQFDFKGKKGVMHNIQLKNKKLAKIVKDCRDIPGKELFQYFDEDGNRKSIDSGCVNQYIKKVTEADFTAKDFRTWAGSLNALQAFAAIEEALDDKTKKANIVKVLDEVSAKLGNTRTVCKKYYVHPDIIKLYEEDKLSAYVKELNAIEKNDNKTGLTTQENMLLKILQSHHTVLQ